MRPFTLVLAALVAGGGAAVLENCRGAQTAKVPSVPPADSQGKAIVGAAQAFLGSLDDQQRKAALFAWNDDAQRARWSNFPALFAREGVSLAQLNPVQRAALMKLLGTVLSPKGMQMVRDQMAADNVLASHPDAGRPGGRAGSGPPPGRRPDDGPPAGMRQLPPGAKLFGADLYFVSFVGQPSTTSPWMLQFGGHHLALNATVAGPNLTLAPSLTGGQPLKFKALDDRRQVYLTKPEIDAAHALLFSLTPDQKKQTIRSDSYIQLVAGPQQDNVTVPAEGISSSQLNSAQKGKLLALIDSRLGIVNADDHAPLLAKVRASIDKLTFGWWGPTEQGKPAYWRVVGPGLVLEYSPQQLGTDDPMQHTHNMYRSPGNDYGKAWPR
jgi:Protein of unknown function (DUF3500)